MGFELKHFSFHIHTQYIYSLLFITANFSGALTLSNLAMALQLVYAIKPIIISMVCVRFFNLAVLAVATVVSGIARQQMSVLLASIVI
jgi:hypothetical protein